MPHLVVILSLLLLSVLTTDGAEIRISGMRANAADNARAFLGDRLEFIEEGDATSSRADDAAFMLERHLIQSGHTSPTVNWSIPNSSTILLQVDPGPRSSLGEVRVQGLDGPLAEEVQAQVQSAHKDVKRLLVEENVPYLPERNAGAIKNANNLLKSKGYWDSTVTLGSATRNPANGLVAIDVNARPGPLHHLRPPAVLENNSLHRDLTDRLAGLTDEPATTANITLARNRVERHYRRSGFQFAQVEMETVHLNATTQLTFRINPGRRFQVGTISVAGNEDVRTRRIAERFDEFPGHHYDADKVDDRLKQLFGTGAFQTLRLDKLPKDDGTIDLTLHVKEGKPDGFFAYAGAGSYEGFILGGSHYHRNLFGNLWNFSTGFEISSLGLLGDIRVTDPWFLGRDMRFTPRAFLLTRSYSGYDKFEGGIGVELEYDINDYYSLTFHFENSFIHLSPNGITAAELGPNEYTLHTLGLRQAYDRRNDPILPSKGYYLELDAELGLAVGEADISFTRIEAEASVFRPVIKDVSHLGARLHGGYIVPSAGMSDIPIDLRFFNGGANSVRSFPERELGPKTANGTPHGGEAYWVANLEYVHTIKGPLRGVAFFDAGTLNPDHTQFGDGIIKYAAGFGLRLDLPIGPVRLEYGRSLSPDQGDPSGAFHFAIGTTF